MSGRNSVVECQLPKLDVAGSSPVARSIEIPISKSRRIEMGQSHDSRDSSFSTLISRMRSTLKTRFCLRIRQ